MPTVSVTLFAGLQQMVGRRNIDVDVPEPATVAHLRDRVVEDYPVLEPFMSTLVCAIGDEMVPTERVLAPGDRVELIPPISGG